MRIVDLLKNIETKDIYGDTNIEVTQLAFDSRKVKEGCLFCCIKGFKSDGHAFANQAVKSGACALLLEDDVEVPNTVVKIFVSNSRKIMGQLAANFYNNPCSKMTMLGVTGTNGKTTITYLVKSILEAAEKKVGVVGTIQNMIGDTILPTERTTPEAIDLQALFKQMVENNVDVAVMEVASHALSLYRVEGCHFDVATFTNLTQDHLDFHETMKEYKEAKSKLFEMASKSIINIDDEAGKEFAERFDAVVTYSVQQSTANIIGKNIVLEPTGAKFTLCVGEQCTEVKLKTAGLFSVYNALAAAGMCFEIGISLPVIKEGLETTIVRGRFEPIGNPKNYSIILDYAHTPDSLENVLKTAENYAKGRVVCLFGCGGDRDASKRLEMGKIAGELADYSIITSDNPRTENPRQIINDIEVGMKETTGEYCIVENRKDAIYYALENAKQDDIIIFAGKGHETYQEINGVKIHFDEKEIVEEWLEDNK